MNDPVLSLQVFLLIFREKIILYIFHNLKFNNWYFILSTMLLKEEHSQTCIIKQFFSWPNVTEYTCNGYDVIKQCNLMGPLWYMRFIDDQILLCGAWLQCYMNWSVRIQKILQVLQWLRSLKCKERKYMLILLRYFR